MSSTIRSPAINGNNNSETTPFIPKSLSASSPSLNPANIASSISRNTAKASDYILNSLTPSPSSSSSTASAALSAVPVSAMTEDDGSPGFFSYFIRFILVAALLAFAGFNIFTQMGIATDDAVKFAEPIIRPLANLLEMITKQTVTSTAEGTKTGIDIVSGATKSGVNVIEDQITGSGSVSGEPIQPSGNGDTKQERARATALTMKTGMDAAAAAAALPEPDDAGSITQKGKVSGKAGFCLVGEDRGIRSCMKVGEGDTCMSGNIFPSKDVCINPSLRV